MKALLAATLVAIVAVSSFAPAPAWSALPVTRAGALDPTFGSTGVIIFNPTTRPEQSLHGSLQADGQFVIGGFAALQPKRTTAAMIRLRENGATDPSFAGSGMAITPEESDSSVESTVIAPDGRIYMIGAMKYGLYQCMVARFMPNGAIDPSFGRFGVAHFAMPLPKDTYCTSGALQPDGKLVVAGFYDRNAFVHRLNANGTPDGTFGNAQGYFAIQDPELAARHVVIGGDGRIAVTGVGTRATDPGVVVMLTASGALDKTFNGTGFYANPYVFAPQVYGGAFLADGRLLVTGRSKAGKPAAFRFMANGTLDPSFGNGGVAEHLIAPLSSAYGRGLVLQADGRIVIALRATVGNYNRFAVLRLEANGSADTTFGSNGQSVIDPGLNITQVINGIQVGPDGKIWLTGTSPPPDSTGDEAFMVARLLGSETTAPVVEFFNGNLGHYFVTADPDEAHAIDAGAAGPGWARTGQTFKSGGPNRVCRFYGSPETDAVTGHRRGPNSHFYTMDPGECAAVKTDAGWNFESYDFNVWPAAVGGACPQGTQAIRRVYNKRFAQNDSNHRYVTTDALYAQMTAMGWSGEGTVFCAVQ